MNKVLKVILYIVILFVVYIVVSSIIVFLGLTGVISEHYKEDKGENKEENYPKTFFIDIDGTIVPYSKYKGELDDKLKIHNYVEDLTPGAKDFFKSLNPNDVVIFTTARAERYRELTERTLKHHNIKYRHLIMDLPVGKRYLINDTRNMLYQKAIAINLLRDKGFGDVYDFNPKS